MSRLIDADALFEYIQKEKAWKQGTMKRPRYDLGKYHAYYEILKIIEKQPTVKIEALNTRAADENHELEKIIRLLESELHTVNKRIEVRQGPCFHDETMKTQLLEGKAQAFERALEIIRQAADETPEPTTEELIEFINDPDARQEQHEYAMYLLEKRMKDENPPLTLDELRGMNGEPAYVVFSDGSGGEYGIVTDYGGDIAVVTPCTTFWIYDNRVGTVYRRKPEEK